MSTDKEPFPKDTTPIDQEDLIDQFAEQLAHLLWRQVRAEVEQQAKEVAPLGIADKDGRSQRTGVVG